MQTIPTNGGTTSCLVRGEGPPLVLLHGFEGNQEVWDGLVPLLCDRWTVITYDQREKGATSFPDASYRMEDLADDFALPVVVHRYLPSSRPVLGVRAEVP